MNGKKAKGIRRKIYGDMALRTPRVYVRDGATIKNHPDSLRAKYQELKRMTK